MNTFSSYLETVGEIGSVTKLNYPIVVVEGLPYVKLDELVIFEEGALAQVFSMSGDSIEALLFSREHVRVGAKVARTDSFLSVGVGDGVLGNVLNSLGALRYTDVMPGGKLETRRIEQEASGINSRAKIAKPFLTGVAMVDLMVPLGCGQKELIIGDRKTGKSSFLLTCMKRHMQSGGVAIYAGIARRESDIKRIQEFFGNEGLLQSLLLVVSTASDPASLIYLTPYTAMTYAEYFRDQGRDVLLVFDDLSSHAKFYREISLLAKRFPGRDSYPGDIFYTHARLLERAGNFIIGKNQEVSITCLPVVETVEGDLTSYIGSNIMGMTDGHIFFDSNAFYRGRRPAINASASVTRVGRQAQTQAKRDINREMTAFLALYEKMQNLSHFGAELTDTVKHILQTGERTYNFFDQPYSLIVPEAVQIVLFCLLWLDLLPGSSIEQIRSYRQNLIHAYETDERVGLLLKEVLKAISFNNLLGNVSKKKEALVDICTTNRGYSQKLT